MTRIRTPRRRLATLALLALVFGAGAGWAAQPEQPPVGSGLAPVADEAAVLMLAEQPSPLATADCVERRSAGVASGTGPGGATDGPAAILAFQRGYFQDRSAAAVREVVAEDAAVPSAVDIQRGIDITPVGTRYCVQITPGHLVGGGPVGVWEVALTVQYPGEQPRVLNQTVTTRYHAGRTVITAITKS
ncbi:hypothetical protein [Nocardia cyriacigeorgica]|uniref:hypothetical protein n=1 Tax=Nocardia cyriacigeorgica TaxID=135487 RepID=UPI0024902760|nr:hypothetical protein [Nocardia cyriacigeorgica]BDU04507.1 hypothetical protein FMUBM48_07700 [Nocardia cyriacigeorgica]